jgi:DNA polymerase-3 subunit beta
MKLTVPKDALSGALRQVLNVVSSRTTLPVLSNVMLEAADEKLVVTGTDLEVSVRAELGVPVTEPGSVTVLARKFGQIVSSLPDGDVLLETDANHHTTLSCKKAFFKIVGMDSAEFPREAPLENGWSFTMTCSEFRKILSKVSYASSPDESRRVLNGILLSLRAGTLTAAATDGRRLALVEKPMDETVASEGDVILPPKAVNEVLKLGQPEDQLVVQLTDRRAAFKGGNTLLVSKLVDGNYPNYRQVIPGSFSHDVVIPRAEFQTVLNRVSMVVSETSASVRLKLDKAQMIVSATSSEFGESNEPLDVSYDAKPIQIAFNPTFLMDPLKHLESDQVRIQFNDEFSPVMMSADDGFLYVLMPMRV